MFGLTSSKLIAKKRLTKLLLDTAQRGVTYVSLTTVTHCINKPNHNIYKVAQINGSINTIYQNAVNNQRIREGKKANFKALPRTWGKHITRGVISHVDQKYLQLIVNNSACEIYVHLHPRLGLRKITKSRIQHLLPKRQKTRQGLKEEKIVRNYSIESIAAISLNKNEFQIKDLEPIRKTVLDYVF